MRAAASRARSPPEGMGSIRPRLRLARAKPSNPTSIRRSAHRVRELSGRSCFRAQKKSRLLIAPRQLHAGRVRYHRAMTKSITSTMAAYRDATLEVFAETLWPTRCAICDAPGAHVCDACLRALPYIDLCRACPRCGAPHGLVQCTECNPVSLSSSGRDDLPIGGLVSAVSLTGKTRRIVTAYKDHGDRALCETMADVMARYVFLVDGRRGDLLRPCNREARRRRGSTTPGLAQTTARRLDVDAVDLFARPRSRDQRTPRQTGAHREYEGTRPPSARRHSARARHRRRRRLHDGGDAFRRGGCASGIRGARGVGATFARA